MIGSPSLNKMERVLRIGFTVIGLVDTVRVSDMALEHHDECPQGSYSECKHCGSFLFNCSPALGSVPSQRESERGGKKVTTPRNRKAQSLPNKELCSRQSSVFRRPNLTVVNTQEARVLKKLKSGGRGGCW